MFGLLDTKSIDRTGAETEEESAKRKALDEKLAADPYGDTFEHFARFCRTNTGAALCDSGMYGRMFNRPMAAERVDPFKIRMWNRRTHAEWEEQMRIALDIADDEPIEFDDIDNFDQREKLKSDFEPCVTVSLEHFLKHNFSATAATRFINELYNWWLYTEENKNVDGFMLDEFMAFAAKMRTGSMERFEFDGDDVKWTKARHVRAAMLRELSNHEERRELLKFFKREDEAGHLDMFDELDLSRRSGDNTYNNDNDLSQDFMFHSYDEGDFYNTKLIVISPHCGADARGGYPLPRFFEPNNDGDWAEWSLTHFVGDGNDCQRKELMFVPLPWWRENKPQPEDERQLKIPGLPPDPPRPSEENWDESNATIITDEESKEEWILVYCGHGSLGEPAGSCWVRMYCGGL